VVRGFAVPGLGLIHLGFLAATAAIAVPVAVHLLLRPRARRVEIGTVRFLLLALRDSTRHRRLRRWLLLALRCAAVLLLALLFARPYLSGSGADGRDREVIILIDQSASMAAVQSGQTLFAKAQEAAEQVLKSLPEQTTVQVAYFDDQGVVPSTEPRVDRTRQAGYAATGYEQALHWARDRLVLSRRHQRTVYLISDLQRPGRRAVPTEGLPPDVAVEVIEIGRPLVRNLAVVQAEATETTLRDRQPVAVTAQVRNAGPFLARGVRIRLVLDGSGAGIEQHQTLQITAKSVQEVHFSVPIARPGLYTGFVEVRDNDDFPLDNRRWLAFDARPPDRLLLVDGEPGRTVYTNETYYLEAALRLRLPGKGDPLTPYEPERLAWNEGATLTGLNRYRAVVLCNVQRMGAPDVQRLAVFVSGGGSLLVFTGSRVHAAGYEPLQTAGLLPAAVEGPAGPDAFRFGTWDTEHPLLRPLSDPQQGDLRRITFHHLTRLKPLPGARVLARTPAGEALLVEGRLGRGTVLLFASAADRDWSDWPQSRLYVPLVHQMVGYLTGRLPENSRVRIAPTGPGRDNAPGTTLDGRAVTVRNLDPAESEIERWSAEEFRKAYNLPKANNGSARVRAANVTSLPESERPGELWAYVVWILLVLLGIEFVIANRTHA
jgi:hypothetical protein